MHICLCSWALGMCKNIWIQTYFGPVTVDSAGLLCVYKDFMGYIVGGVYCIYCMYMYIYVHIYICIYIRMNICI